MNVAKANPKVFYHTDKDCNFQYDLFAWILPFECFFLNLNDEKLFNI